MSTMIVEVYAALKAAGVPEDKAIQAAKSDIAKLEGRLIRIEMILAIILAAVVLPLIRDFLS